jgi:hypothetical protein
MPVKRDAKGRFKKGTVRPRKKSSSRKRRRSK